jgi:hypothetical protein
MSIRSIIQNKYGATYDPNTASVTLVESGIITFQNYYDLSAKNNVYKKTDKVDALILDLIMYDFTFQNNFNSYYYWGEDKIELDYEDEFLTIKMNDIFIYHLNLENNHLTFSTNLEGINSYKILAMVYKVAENYNEL